MKKPKFLEKVKHIHFTGIKGVGMAALACCAQDLGLKITGSDIEEIFVTDELLKKRKIKWEVGFSPKNLEPKPDLAITTAAHGGLENPEVVTAGQKGVPILTHAQALGKFMEGKEGISVCGVGGKSTTASMAATVLSLGRRKPSFAIGVGEIKPLGAPGKYDQGNEFVAEADEYANSPPLDKRPRFSFQKPKVIIVTNIEYDHPDVYRDLDQTKAAFKSFFQTLSKDGLLLANIDNINASEVARKSGVNHQTYGFSPEADWQIENLRFGEEKMLFDLSHQKAKVDEIVIKAPGRFNVMNATAAFAAVTFFGLDAKTVKKGLAEFQGTKRRFEQIGEAGEVNLYDDYAHHPNQIREVLIAAGSWFPKRRLIVVFQPHTYSRTKALFKQFAQAFNLAKVVVITDIYSSAREKETLGVSGEILAQEVSKYHPRAAYKPGEKEVSQFLTQTTRPGDIIFTMGAGDIFLWHKSILAAFRR